MHIYLEGRNFWYLIRKIRSESASEIAANYDH